MKRLSFVFVLAAALCALCAAGCSNSSESSSTQPQTRPGATLSEPQVTTQPVTKSAAATKPAKATTNKKKKTTASATSPARPAQTPAATVSPTAPKNVPGDTISGANINPNIGSIADRVTNEINSKQVTGISLSESDIELTVSETAEITVTYTPADAMYKICSTGLSSSSVAEITGKSNTGIKIKGKAAGTCVLTVTSQNGHKATCGITVKRNETITDDSKIPHADLCTADNVNRWAAEITAECQSLGMKQNASLKGVDIALDTAENADKTQSYNEVKSAYVQSVKTQLESLVEGDYKDYVFNCYVEAKDGGEYYINVVISKAAE